MGERLADPLAGLSRFADLGFGLPAGTSLRSAVVAVRLARALGGTETDAAAAFWTALLQHVGCVAYAHESAQLFGDDLAANAAISRTNLLSIRDFAVTFLPRVTAGRPPAERVRLALVALTRGGAWGEAFGAAACEVGAIAARRLGLPEGAQEGLTHAYDLWRGRASAGAAPGEATPLAARVARVAGVAAQFDGLGGRALAVAAVRERSAGMLDPAAASVFVASGASWLGELAASDPREIALAEEPDPVARVGDLRQTAEVFGDLADLKSPCFTGHSRRVALLAQRAAQGLRLAEEQIADLALAGHLHDVGRVAISNAIWDKPGALTPDEWEQARLHPYHTERILAASASLSPVAPVAGRHHERLDGSGYYRGSIAADLSVPARILAAAECLATASEPRPHRPARTSDQARRHLLEQARAGRLDPDAVTAVLAAAGQPVGPTRGRPGTLSHRELEVLRLLARGSSNPEIAQRLVISPRTAEHHVYAKIGVSSRAAAALYAVEHRLLDG
ncbi:MAG: HD domain-containing phosphohydrolase [Actinomycetes bacterium]